MATGSDNRTNVANGARRERGTGAAYVYERLREEILGLQLEPGTLLDETELASRFGVSRSPVREALIRLGGEGLVDTLRNRSSIVATFDIAALFGYFDALDLMYRVTARLAATAASVDDIRAIKKALAAHDSAVNRGAPAEIIACNRAFHLAIAAAGGNPFFVAWTRTVLDQGQRLMGFYLRGDAAATESDYVGEHHDIVAAIEARAPAIAEAHARADVEIMSQRFSSLLEKRRDGVSGTSLANLDGAAPVRS
jgi:DNA-binding GntR family transcriptional regulator